MKELQIFNTPTNSSKLSWIQIQIQTLILMLIQMRHRCSNRFNDDVCKLCMAGCIAVTEMKRVHIANFLSTGLLQKVCTPSSSSPPPHGLYN